VSILTKVFVVLTSVVAIVLSCLTVATAARWSNLRENLDTYQQLYQGELVKRMNAEAVMATSLAMKDDELQSARNLVSKRDDEARQLGDQVATLRTDLARRTNEAQAANTGRTKLEAILEVQRAELSSTQKQNQSLNSQNTDLQTRNQRLAARNLELTGQVTIAVDENRNLQEKLYAAEQMNKDLQRGVAAGARTPAAGAPPTGVTPVTPQVAGPISGEVTQVEQGYVSINVGDTSGVAPGMEFMVYRGQTYLGDLKIDMVRPKEAGGKLTLVKAGLQVQRGDRVVYGM
jgi:hypothetical protein